MMAEVEEGTEDAAVQRGRLSVRLAGLGRYDRRYTFQQVDLLKHEVGVYVSRHLCVQKLLQISDFEFNVLKLENL